jgi:hypothetical protein
VGFRVSCILLSNGMSLRPNSNVALPLAVIGAVACGVVLPFLWLGIPSGHDFEVHFNAWVEVLDHWKQGILYPHWAGMSHYGYGEARFIFYPPISWNVGAVLGMMLPWKLVPAAYIWITLLLSGVSMFVLARRWLPRADALFAAALYTANPYHLVIVYWRSAMAELLAAAYLPLLLLLILRSDADEDAARVVAPLSLLMAMGWLTNIPSAVMMNYSLGLLALIVAISRRSFFVIAYGAAAATLGTALAAFYLVPVLHQQSWVNLGQVLAPGVRPADNFLFTAIAGDPDHYRFNLLASLIAVWQITIVAVALVLARRLRKQEPWWPLAAWSAMAAVLMAKFTLPLWIHLPELRYVQLPWRWLLCLNVPFAVLVVLAIRRWWLRGLVYAAMLALLLLLWQRVQVPWWDNAADIKEMVDDQHDGPGYEGTDEYAPAAADPYAIDQQAPKVLFQGNGDAELQVQDWNAESRQVIATTSAPGRLVFRMFNYPLWKVLVNGRTVVAETVKQTGQLTVPVAAGESRIQIRFVESWDRAVGAAISTVALVLMLFWAWQLKGRVPRVPEVGAQLS